MLRFGRGDIEYYMTGACPYFAIALHKLTGWPLAMLTDDAQSWESGVGVEEYPFIAHVFVVTPDEKGLDIKGPRPLPAIKAEYHDLIEPRIEIVGLSELRALMGDLKPLCRYDAREIKEAMALAEKLLAS